MKLRHLLMAVIAGAFAFTSCEEELDLGAAKIAFVEPAGLVLNFGPEESSATVTFVCTRDWNISEVLSNTLPDWIALSATSGEGSAKEQSVTVTVMANPGNDRETGVTFTIGLAKATVLVKQAGEKGEYVVPAVSIADFIKTDGQTEYIISGKVTSVNADYKYAYINDGTAEVEVYKPTNWDEYASKIKVGATMKAQGVYTKYTNSSGKTYDELVGVILEVIEKENQTDVQTVTCAEFIKTDGATEYIISGKITSMNADYKYAYVNDGTAEVEVYKPTNWDEYASKIKVGATMKAQGVYTKYTNSSGKTYDELVGVILEVIEKENQTDVQTVTCAEFIKTDGATEYIISGKITSMNADYKYAYVNDGTAEVEVYKPTNWDEYASKIKVGATMKAQGVYTKYTNSSGKTYDELVGIILEVTEGTDPVSDETQADPAGDGSQASPFNVSAAINKAKEVGKTATEQDFYVKGKVSKVSEQFSAAYGNGTFELVDEGFTAVFTAYRILYLGNKKWEEGDATVAVGDELVAVGKIVNYNENTPEITQGGYLYSLNGQTSIEQGNVFGVEKTTINVSASATSAEIKVKGNVAWTVSRKPDEVSCNPTSGEGAGTITVTFPANESTENEVGYTIALSTEADVTNKTIMVNIIQAKVGDSGAETFESNISWTSGSNQSYSEKATVNEVANVPLLKLGTGSKTGSSVLTLPAGSTSLTFYALSWKAKPSKLVFKIGDSEVASVEPAANDGLANSSPYTLTVTDSDKYTITFSATSEITVETSGSNTRCALFGAVAK